MSELAVIGIRGSQGKTIGKAIFRESTLGITSVFLSYQRANHSYSPSNSSVTLTHSY